jgi:hypothetical protein
LPSVADTAFGRDCPSVEAGVEPMATLGPPLAIENRGFQCRWDDRTAGRATCTYETRFKPAAEPNAPWPAWSRETVRLRHIAGRGWWWVLR